ncbi:MAG: hypothetical protein QMB51_02180, partial [Patescibacteria group bacterium]
IQTKKNLLKNEKLDEIISINDSILNLEKEISELKKDHENLSNEIKTRDEIVAIINEFNKENESMFQKYEPFIEKLFEKFKNNDFQDKEFFEEVKNDIEKLFENNEINQNIKNYLINYTESLKNRVVEDVCKNNGIIIFHTINFGTTGVNSNIKNLSQDSDVSTNKKLSTLISLEPTISASSYNFKENEDMVHQFGSGLSFIISNGYIDEAHSGDAGTMSENSGIKGSKARNFYDKPFSKSYDNNIHEVKDEKLTQDIQDSINPKNKGVGGFKYNEILIQNPKISSFFVNIPEFLQKEDRLDFLTEEENAEYEKLKKGELSDSNTRGAIINKIISNAVKLGYLPSTETILNIKNKYKIPLLFSICGKFYLVNKNEGYKLLQQEDILNIPSLDLSNEQKDEEFKSLFNENGEFLLQDNQLGLSSNELEEIRSGKKELQRSDLSL